MKNVNLLCRLVANFCSIALFLLLSLSFSASAQQKVVGGVDVDIKDYPWQVALTSSPSGSGFCGGSIIGDSWVLTAAHCVNGTSASGLYIRCGASASFASGGDSYSVNQIIVHPSYSGNSYDFALVEINGEFAYNSNVQKIDLIDEAEIAAGAQDGGVMSTITGWGTTSSGGSLASVLQMVEAPIVNNDVACGSANDSNGNSGQYPCSSLDASMICAGDLINGGEDACQGDSGGPLAVRSSDDSRWLLIGATSWGYGCADVIYPGVWSKVSYVLDWINDNADVDSEFGCMDPSACNYSEEAIYDNGSCVELDECGDCGGNGPAPGYDCDGNCTTGETLVVTMSDSYGDGWNGNNLVVNGTSLTIGSGSSGSGVVCYDSAAGCVDVTCDGGSYQSEVSWEISDADGNVLLSGGAPFVGAFGAEGCGPVYGCIDSLALNFDPLATTNDDSCLYPVVGCMDSLALNYNADAVEDDGSCTYPLDCADLTYVNIEVGGGLWSSEVSWEMNGNVGEAGSTELCLEADCYIFNMYDSWGDGWNGNTVTVFAGNDILLTGTLEAGFEGVLSFSLNYDGICGPVYGCLDSTALNFDPVATANDNSCLYPTLGCTDTLALNYNELATEDDGSCTYPLDCEGLTTIMIEVGGGFYDSEISWELNGLEGVSGSTESCLESGCYTFNMYDSWGDGWNGATVSVTIGGEVLVSGTLDAGTSGALMFSYNEDCGYVNGCTDSTALNFNPEATINDGSCEYEQGACDDGYVLDCNGNCAYETWIGDGLCDDGSYALGGVDIYFNCEEFGNDGGDCGDVVVDSLGCTDPNASNYNPNAFADDGSCIYDVESGCTDAEALNYNPNAIEDDGSCEYPIDCEGLTTVMIDMSDSYGDGWNGNVLTMNGQSFTIESGSESSATACYNSDSGDCAYVTCDGGSWQSEVSWTISDIDGNVLLSGGAPFDGAFGGDDCGPIYGCTDPFAVNYNELATDDDGSCEYVASGCTDIDALNYDSEAIQDDGSCQYQTECTGFDATLSVNNVSFGAEHTWSIADGNGTALYNGGEYGNNSVNTIELCLEENASYEITLMDAYGDGWNGGTFSISTSNCELVSGGLEEGILAEFDFTTSCDDPCASLECQEGYECVNGDCILIETSAPWDFTITGSNHTIVLDGEAVIDLNDMPIEIGDALGVFYTDDNGDLQCGGFALWTGSTNSIAAQGNDTTTDEIDGFTTGSSFVWMIWDASEDMVYAANATYSTTMPNQGDYTTNGISALASLTAVASVSDQTMDMPFGWSIFSTYLSFETMDLATLLSSIFDQIIICKNNAGDAYLPEWGFNGIGDVEVGQGYQIKLLNDINITAEGEYMAPEDNPIDLTAGWNMIGYLRLEPADAAAVLFDINATNNLVIVKDYAGQAYLPEWDFNGIGDMKPGEGYQLKLNNDDVLTYISNDDSYRVSSITVTNNAPTHFEKVTLTDNNMTVVIEDASWDILPENGAEIGAYDASGNLVGSVKYTSPVTVLTLWGDDVTTISKDGLETIEVSSFKVWSNNQTTSFEITEWSEGSSAYTADAINIASSISTSNIVTQELSTIRELVRVINVLGQEVNVQDVFKGEVLFNVYNDGTVEMTVN